LQIYDDVLPSRKKIVLLQNIHKGEEIVHKPGKKIVPEMKCSKPSVPRAQGKKKIPTPKSSSMQQWSQKNNRIINWRPLNVRRRRELQAISKQTVDVRKQNRENIGPLTKVVGARTQKIVTSSKKCTYYSSRNISNVTFG